MKADDLIENVRRWAQRDDRVIAAGICGSYARGEAGPGSDIDFCILSHEPQSLLENRAWIFALGERVRIIDEVEDYKLVQAIRVFFDRTEAEFGLTAAAWATLPLDVETAAVISSGLLVLYDPEQTLEQAIEFAAAMAR